jgi:hypothetical protein
MIMNRFASSIPLFLLGPITFGALLDTGCQTAPSDTGASADESASIQWLDRRWTLTETNSAHTPATWTIPPDQLVDGKPVLALTQSANSGHTFNLAIREGEQFQDVDLRVKVQAVAGEEDQGGGPIWRVQDAENYYICRFNPLESNYRVYYVKDGRRKQLASAELPTRAGRWYTVRVVMLGDKITCYLDGVPHLEVQDATFSDAGKVGVWTKADAVTSFGAFEAKPVLKR